MEKEARARILINDLLRRSGWRFFGDKSGPANVALETHVNLTKRALDDMGKDFEETAHGFVDYLLLDQRGFPIAVLEAKSEKFDPLVGKEQARKYARSQNVRFVILSNGNLQKGIKAFASRAIGQANISASNLASYEIALPPLPIQRRIVEEIEAERALVEANRKLVEIFERKIQAKLAEIWGEDGP